MVAVSNGCSQDSVVSCIVHLLRHKRIKWAGTLLLILELIYLLLAQCQFYIQVNGRRKLHLPLCSLPWGGSLCLHQSTVEYSDKFHSINHTATLTMTEECIPQPIHSHSQMYVKWEELSSRLSHGETQQKQCPPPLLFSALFFAFLIHTVALPNTHTCCVARTCKQIQKR